MTLALCYDVETNGFLRKMDRIHCMNIRNLDTKEVWRFRKNEQEDTISQGVEMLAEADVVIGHNLISFDNHAVKKIFPKFQFKKSVVIRDTMILCRVAAPDIKDHDMALWRKGLLPGGLIGSHSLEAWGYRINKNKGDYAKEMEAKGLDPWAAWNPEMDDYCDVDNEITVDLFNMVMGQHVPDTCVSLEHEIQALCARMEQNGFPFDREAAVGLSEKLRKDAEVLESRLRERYGFRFVPVSKKQIRPYFYDPDGKNKAKEDAELFAKPDADLGEDMSRTWWSAVTTPKRSQLRNGIQYTQGAPYCKAHWVEFNPGSRQQVVARLVEDHGWVPSEFTETGQPSLDGPSLEKLAATQPVAADISELFFLRKLLGQIADGPQSWIRNYDETTGAIHAYTNTGGAVTGRCTHSSPNIAQVPAVIVGKDKHPVLGRAGEYGWECRSMFRVPPHWMQVGVDLKGIELRCLAALTRPYDGGELCDVVISGDPHAYNMEKSGIPDRGIIKRVLYGLLYGAGNEKLGLTAKPTASPNEARMIGAQLRAQLMAGLPALKKAIDVVQGEAERRGYLIGLDGRRLKVRATYSALNTRLQSDAALIAKKWMILTEQYAVEAGMFHGWNTTEDGTEYLGDFAMMAFIHDESQSAVAPDRAEEFGALCVRAAVDAGKFFNFGCAIDAEPKIGRSWAECH